MMASNDWLLKGLLTLLFTVMHTAASKQGHVLPDRSLLQTGPCPAGFVPYGLSAGGFCCKDGGLSADKLTCNTWVCAFESNPNPQGKPYCVTSGCPASCPAGSTQYGCYAGGFCCFGQVLNNGSNCSPGSVICAVPGNPNPQGNPVCQDCPSNCPAGWNQYGCWAGGFCCKGLVVNNGNNCMAGSAICALPGNPNPQGQPICQVEGNIDANTTTGLSPPSPALQLPQTTTTTQSPLATPPPAPASASPPASPQAASGSEQTVPPATTAVPLRSVRTGTHIGAIMAGCVVACTMGMFIWW